MKKLSRVSLVMVSTLVYCGVVHAGSIPNTDNPRTFLGPTARIGVTSTLNDYTAYNLAGEAGIKNFRIGGTLGWNLAANQRFKVSAEYLWQKITYAFFSGNTDKWVDQGALGAAYQYDFEYNFHPQFDLSAYASHAPSKSLSTVTGNFTNAQGSLVPFTDTRRIAGSNGAGIAPGLAVMPWQGGRVSAELNYDSVRYNNKYVSNKDAIGIGGTIGLNQAITDNLGLGLAAAVRQPFNNYAASLSWSNVPYFGMWALSLFGDYTVGKNSLPNTYNVGLSADYFLDQRCGHAVPVSLKGENLKGEATTTMQPYHDNLLAWTGDPAVYMPQVLAIVDERVTSCNGAAPTVTSPLSDLLGITTVQNINAAGNFSGNNLTFSSSVSGTINPATTVSITPQGALTITPALVEDQSFTVTVTATNSCGSTSSSFLVTIEED